MKITAPPDALERVVTVKLTIEMCMNIINILQRQLILPGIAWVPAHETLVVAVERALTDTSKSLERDNGG